MDDTSRKPGLRRVTGEAAGLLCQLVAIDSVNPDLAVDGKGERQIAEFVADWLASRGLKVELQETEGPHRPNVVAVARGSGGGRTMMLNGHMDTVGLDAMPDGLAPRIEGERLYGRGACDMKGGLAALMLASADLAERDLRGDVVLAAVIDEEYTSLGTTSLVRNYRADAAIVAEPTSLGIAVAHKGFVWLEIATRGRAAHGSLPDAGIDAIAKMGPVLVGIDALGRRLAGKPSHALLGAGSVHASLIHGGHEVSTYPADCLLTIERRTVPPESDLDVQEEIQVLLDGIARSDPDFRASVRTTFSRPWLDGSPGQPLAQMIARELEARTGRRSEIVGAPFWTDASILTAAGIPSVVFGPHGEDHHGAAEWVDLPSVQTCREVVAEVATRFCA